MRWFIVFLIVANVILFFWVNQQSRPMLDSSTLPPPDIGRLRLSSEADEEPPVVSLTPPPEEVVVLAPVVPVKDAADEVMPEHPAPVAFSADGVRPDAPESDAEEPEDTVMAGEPVPEEPVAGVASATGLSAERVEPLVVEMVVEPDASVPELPQPPIETAGDPPDVPVEKPEATDRGESAPGPVVDASAMGDTGAPGPTEREVIAQAEVVEPEPEVAEPAGAAVDTGLQVPAAVCARVGPFEPADADRLVSTLPVETELLSDVSEEYAQVDRYYVLIPPLPSRADGRRMLKRLADAGFTDTWLFPSGEYRNAISLGYFSRESGARRHAGNIAKKGFETEVREKSKVRQRRWLLLKNAGGEEPGTGLKLPKGVGIEPRTCP